MYIILKLLIDFALEVWFSIYQNLEISNCDPFNYKMDKTMLIVTVFMEKSITMKRVKVAHNMIQIMGKSVNTILVPLLKKPFLGNDDNATLEPINKATEIS